MSKADNYFSHMLYNARLSGITKLIYADKVLKVLKLATSKISVNSKVPVITKAGLYVQDNSSFSDLADAIPHHSFPDKQPILFYNFSGKTVLIVDDILINLSLMEVFFRNTGASLLFAVNGREAIHICISNPKVDIVLMDIQMPVMNGIEATREIRNLLPEMAVIAVTATVNIEDKQKCFDAGCNAFLSKPYSRNDVLAMVNDYL